MKAYQGFKDLIVYQKAFDLSIRIFKISRSFPKEELYSLTDQIRRASRSIGANIAESWPKRRYVKSFVAKLIDAQSEACETIHWLDEVLALDYIAQEDHQELMALDLEIQRMLDAMITYPEKFCHKMEN
ncbi:MAG: four helix bundle protein [Bacteroides sp.]|jgi:four helix bundle protein|nr:four helix bundle protein [Bacteroides sp.]